MADGNHAGCNKECYHWNTSLAVVLGRFGQASKQYIYEYLTEQPIWWDKYCYFNRVT